MNRYKRRHTSSNSSRGVFWIIATGVIVYLVYKVIMFKQEFDEVHDREMQEKEKPKTYFIIDSLTGKRDTVEFQYYPPQKIP